MQNPSLNEIMATAQALRRYNEYAQGQSALNKDRKREGNVLENHGLPQVKSVENIVAKFILWFEELKQKQTVRTSHFHSVDTGQALPLVFTRFLCPRFDPTGYAERTCVSNRSRPQTRQIRSLSQS